MLLTRLPRYRGLPPFAFDLHVLGTPPAFVLSQDQTLQLIIGTGANTGTLTTEDRSSYRLSTTTASITKHKLQLLQGWHVLFSFQRTSNGKRRHKPLIGYSRGQVPRTHSRAKRRPSYQGFFGFQELTSKNLRAGPPASNPVADKGLGPAGFRDKAKKWGRRSAPIANSVNRAPRSSTSRTLGCSANPGTRAA